MQGEDMDWKWTSVNETRVQEPAATDHEVQGGDPMVIDENTSGGNNGSTTMRDETMDDAQQIQIVVKVLGRSTSNYELHVLPDWEVRFSIRTTSV
ncbi:hypothetical protein CMUS01_13672 [Colletotrichum musicola]|uniref:Uncharacterized protein n=1 Tax=Colletotrichum musicola TaxID=2175873 RepID=A0A8H6MV70_9PEZI|nr:hypothetical protein CMUS01_13672 [Colletotrichum musicola]